MKNKIPWKKYLLRAAIILPAVLVLLYIGWNNTDQGRYSTITASCGKSCRSDKPP